jgi:hypothetical protein
VEQDGSLRIDSVETIARLKSFVAGSRAVIDAEVKFVRRENIALIVADVPFLAGLIAERTGVPCIAIANFTWDWIFEPMLAGDPRGAELLDLIRSGYGHMSEWLRLPFHHETDVFPRITDVPLGVGIPVTTNREVLGALGIQHDDPRRRVLVARRGGFSCQTLRTAAAAAPEFMFLHLGDVEGHLPDNARAISRASDLTFRDLLQVSDTLISKLGYATLAECVAAGTSVLYPPRAGFREDEILAVEAQRLLNAREISVADFETGRWADALRQLWPKQPPSDKPRLDGEIVCARVIAKYLNDRH